MQPANDPGALELSVSRTMAAPVDAVWRAYTERLNQWFCPPPWRAEVDEMDLRTGGRAGITMYGPNGEVMPQDGVYLEVVQHRLIVFTDAFTAGWKPAGPFMLGFFEFTPDGERTHYRGGARHWTREAYEQHKAMGFEQGWGKVAEQWEEVARQIAAESRAEA